MNGWQTLKVPWLMLILLMSMTCPLPCNYLPLLLHL